MNTRISCLVTIIPLYYVKTIKNNFNWIIASYCVLRWLLLLKEYGVKFEYLPEKKSATVVENALSHLEIGSLNIQEEEVLTRLSGSENSITNHIKFPIHTALTFKAQAKVKGTRLIEKGLAQTH
jgi:hypothetical protein